MQTPFAMLAQRIAPKDNHFGQATPISRRGGKPEARGANDRSAGVNADEGIARASQRLEAGNQAMNRQINEDSGKATPKGQQRRVPYNPPTRPQKANIPQAGSGNA